MKKINKMAVAMAVAALVGCAPLYADDGMVANYFSDTAGTVVKNSAGECWRTSSIDTTDKKVECGYPAPEPVVVEEVVVIEKVTPTVVVAQEIVAAPTAATVTTAVDKVITIDAAVLFGFDSAELSADGKAVIDERFEAFEGVDVERTAETVVVGHTDSTGPEAYNQGLSERRAQSIADYLKHKNKVSDPQIEVVGMGESEPVADNGTRDGRALNRRVVIRFEGVVK